MIVINSSVITFLFVGIHVRNSLRAFRYCCSFCISPRLYNSSIKLLASVRVSVWHSVVTLEETPV